MNLFEPWLIFWPLSPDGLTGSRGLILELEF